MMPLTKIWERYFLKQFIGMFFLFLLCFYGLYVIIDYASHTSEIMNHQVQVTWQEIVLYYLFIFSSRAEILIPLALMIAFVHTICSLNTHNELVAFMAGGFSLKKLLSPFLFLAILSVFLIYLNEQFILPKALIQLKRFEDATKHKRNRRGSKLAVHHLKMDDGSTLIFQDYDVTKEQFFDVYWIQSMNNIIRMKSLSPLTKPPKGYFADRLTRQSDGELIQQEAYHELPLPEMKFQNELLQSTLFDPDILPLSELSSQAFATSNTLDEKESKILTAFYWKLMIPWLCLFAIIAPAPYCVTFSRQLPLFFIYVCSLFGLIALYMFMDAAQVIAKRQVLPPFWAICAPFFMIFGFFGYRFFRL